MNNRPLIALSISLVASALALAQDAAPTSRPGNDVGAAVVDLWPTSRPFAATQPEWTEARRTKDGRPARFVRDVREPTLTCFPVEGATAAPAVVICPGGGYAGESIDREGYDVARRLNEMGVAAFVLKYRLPAGVYREGAMPLPIEDARRAIRVVRARAGEWNVDASRVGIVGFSAGGHLAGSVTVNLAGDAPDDAGDAASKLSARPDFSVLIYPVIALRDPLAHKGSRNNLIGTDAPAERIERYSVDAHVTPQTPPTFIVHADDDKTVPIGNATAFVAAAEQAGVSVHFEHYKTGGHGFGLGAPGTEASAWPAKLDAWLKERGVK